VTKRSRVDIIARLDASPLAGETVRLSYRGALYDLATGPDGSVSIELPYYEGEIVTASMRDQAQNEVVSHPCNEITFNFVTPKAIVETDIEVTRQRMIERNSPRDTWKLAHWDEYVAGRDYSTPSIPALSDCLIKFYNSNDEQYKESMERITKFLLN
jgi:hypothetical protein